MNKKIGIDCRLIHETGPGVYIQNLLRHLPFERQSIDWFFFTTHQGAITISNILPGSRGTIVITPVRWHSIREQTVFLKRIMHYNLDLMHFPYVSYPILYMRPFVITIHDLTPLDLKTGQATTLNPLVYEMKHQAYKLVLYSALRRSRAIIVPSHWVKKQIGDRFDKKIEEKVVVTYEGVNEALLTTKPNLELSKKYKKQFIFRLGNFYPHKNIERLIAAYSLIKTDTQLILAGPKDFFSSKIEQLIEAVENKESILLAFNATHEDLVFFYTHALALIQPSLAEGFGLPIIEAEYFNCPVIASKIPVFEELLDSKHPYFFDPIDTQSMKDVIQKFLQNHKKRIFSQTNNQILEKYSFKKMAHLTAQVYEDVLTHE